MRELNQNAFPRLSAMKIQITESTKKLLEWKPDYVISLRGQVEIKVC